MSGLSNQALIMSLNFSQWSAIKTDKEETQAVADKHGISVQSATVRKKLFLNAASLKRVQAKSVDIRREFHKVTIPWGHNQGIFKADAYLTVAPAFAAFKTEWYDLVEQFLSDYTSLYNYSKYELQTLHKEEDYPDVTQLRGMFKMDVNFSILPKPEDCSKIATLGEFADTLAQEMAAQYSAREQSAMDEAWERLYQTVIHAKDRLADPEKPIFSTLFENAREMCAILPSLNISNDPNLEAMRQEVENSLCQYEAKQVRKNPVFREEAAIKMDDIMSKMSAFYG